MPIFKLFTLPQEAGLSSQMAAGPTRPHVRGRETRKSNSLQKRVMLFPKQSWVWQNTQMPTIRVQHFTVSKYLGWIFIIIQWWDKIKYYSNFTKEETEFQERFQLFPKSQTYYGIKPELKSNTSYLCPVLFLLKRVLWWGGSYLV